MHLKTASASVRSPRFADAREREKARALQQGPREKITREVIIPETITIQELANRMAERGRGRDQTPDEAGPAREGRRHD